MSRTLIYAVFLTSVLLASGCLDNGQDPFGEPPKGSSPNCGPEARYDFPVNIGSKEDFVKYIKNNRIDPGVRLDNFKEEGEVNWDRALSAVRTGRAAGRVVYSLDYTPAGCGPEQINTIKMTNDGHVSVYGCCGE